MASPPDLIQVIKGRKEACKLLLIGEVIRNSSTLVRNKRKQLRN